MSDVTGQSPRDVILDEWATRLESGKYLQGQGRLHVDDPDGNRYCCLGVLCEMAVEAGVVQQYTSDSGTVLYGPEGNVIEAAELPEVVADWAQVTTMGEMIEAGPGEGTLIYLNDSEQASFRDIARVIRARNLRGLPGDVG